MPGVDGRVALVTGAGRGIGLAAARLLVAQGAKIMCVSRSEPELAAIGLPYVVADLGTEAGCMDAVQATRRELGAVEILVCNHGIGSAAETVVWEQNPALWRETLRINLDGPFYLSRLVLRDMVESRYGRLVYTSSTAGLVAEPEGCAYNASKHGLLGLMRSVAVDGGPHGITANAVLPGWVRTAMAERSAEAEAQARGESVAAIWEERNRLYPAGRIATVDEVAQTIAFLAAEESSGVSGEAIRVALGSVC